MKVVVYYTKFRDSQWWRIRVRLHTNKYKPIRVGKPLQQRHPLIALLIPKQQGNVWLEVTILSWGIAFGILHGSHQPPKDSQTLKLL